MSKRFWIMAALAAVTLIFQGMAVYFTVVLKSPVWFLAMGLRDADITGDGRLKVLAVGKEDARGRPTAASLAGIKPGDTILSVWNARNEGAELEGLAGLGSALRAQRYGEASHIFVGRPAAKGKPETIRLEIPPFTLDAAPGADVFFSVTGPRLLVLLLAVTAFFIGFLKPDDNNSWRAALLFLSFTTIFGPSNHLFPGGFREVGMVYWSSFNTFSHFLFMQFFLLFPSPSWIQKKAPFVRVVAFSVTALVYLPLNLYLGFASLHSLSKDGVLPPLLQKVMGAEGYFVLFTLVVGIVSLFMNTFMARNKDERRRMVILLSGTLAGLLPLVGLLAWVEIFHASFQVWMLGVVILTLMLFPLSFIYVVVKHRVFGIGVILRRGLQYALVSRGFLLVEGAALFVVFLFGVAPLFQKAFPLAGKGDVALCTAAATGAVLMGLRQVNRRIMPSIDRNFFREAYNVQRILKDLSTGVRRLVTRPDELLRMVTDQVGDALHPDQVAVFLQPVSAGVYCNETANLPMRIDPASFQNFVCCRQRLRPVVQQVAISDAEGAVNLDLDSNSFIARYLEQVVSREPEAVDVYLDDPRSWTGSLVRADPSETRYRERLILERLNTRLIVPMAAHGRVFGFISLGEKMSEEPYTREDKELLLTVAEQTAVALDYSRLIREAAEQAKLRRDLEIAREVQSQLFPQTQPSIPGLEYTGVCRPALGIGGDYYDFIHVGSNSVGLALGDISGKGIAAAILMSNLQAALRSHAAVRGEDVSHIMSEVNRQLCASVQSGKFATFFYGVYDGLSRRLTYVNAGHNPPMLFREPGALISPRTSTSPAPLWSGGPPIRLEVGGTVLGVMCDARYEQASVALETGDLLVIFTDGVSEAVDPAQDEFSEGRLERVVASHAHLPVEELRDRILTEVEVFASGAPQHDDITLIIARVL